MAIIEVVKYNGSPDIFAWKFPNEELGTWTQLIVNESQEAILVKGGKVLDIFQSGRHTLDTANIPLLCNLINLPFGGKSPFTAEIWFINKAYNLDIKWGTPSPIQVQDPKYGVFVPVRSNGAFGIQIENSKTFLVKLVGTLASFSKDSITKYFRSLYISKVKDAISTYLVQEKISILEINAYIEELSDYMKERIQPTMKEYGISLVNFYVNDISVPEDDPAVQKLKEALAKRAEMNIIGYNYQQERSFDTMEGAAKNPGSMSAPIMGAGLGLGMGMGMGPIFGQQFGNMVQTMNTIADNTIECPNCHSAMAQTQRFCSACGFDMTKTGGKDEEEKKEENRKASCSGCGTAITPQNKFCPECGRKMNPCQQCGTDLPDGAKSCSQCGYVIPSPCPKCGVMVPSGVKFCPECGEALAKTCPKCKTPVEDGVKFCPECGEKLQ